MAMDNSGLRSSMLVSMSRLTALSIALSTSAAVVTPPVCAMRAGLLDAELGVEHVHDFFGHFHRRRRERGEPLDDLVALLGRGAGPKPARLFPAKDG